MERHNLIERFLARRADQKGLALLDVLLGMAIFALIALIAVTSIGQFRQRAYITGAASDAKAISVGIDAESTNGNVVTPASTLTVSGGKYQLDLDGAGTTFTPQPIATVSKGNEIGTGANFAFTYIPATATAGDGYAFCIRHRTGGTATSPIDAFATYNSTTGGIVLQDKGDCR